MNNLLIHESMQSLLYKFNLFSVNIEWNLFQIGKLYYTETNLNATYYAPCRLQNGLFSLTCKSEIIGYILVIRNELVQLFDEYKETPFQQTEAFYIDSAFTLPYRFDSLPVAEIHEQFSSAAHPTVPYAALIRERPSGRSRNHTSYKQRHRHHHSRRRPRSNHGRRR